MAYLREILTEGHPALRKVAKKVRPEELNDPLFQQLIDDMFATMYNAPGIGLAAPQINVSKRLFVVDLRDDEEDEKEEDPGSGCGHDHDHDHAHGHMHARKKKTGHGPLVFVNPRFSVTEGEIQSVEGCLSVPGKIGDVTRFERVVCNALDRHGRKITLTGAELFGRCLQHEMDHLDGVLYVDKAKNIRSPETAEETRVLEETQAAAT